MTNYDALVRAAQPKIATVLGYATESVDWLWTLQVNILDPTTGAPIDLTGSTGVCTIKDKISGTTLATPTYTGGPGTITLKLPAASSANTAGDLGQYPTERPCLWDLIVTLGDGRQVQIFGPDPFTIYQEL